MAGAVVTILTHLIILSSSILVVLLLFSLYKETINYLPKVIQVNNFQPRVSDSRVSVIHKARESN